MPGTYSDIYNIIYFAQYFCCYLILCLIYRQKHLDDALLISGQFKEALQVLLDWLYKVEPTLSESIPVHGDIDTVNCLIEQHKVKCR